MKTSHGANIFELSRKYGFEIEDIRDFSSNINPLGTSEKALTYLKDNLELVSTYPDPEYFDLKNSISNYTDSNVDDIFLGSGTTQLLIEYINYINPKRAMILSPCYSEYEVELKKINSHIFHYKLSEELEFKIDIEDLVNQLKENKIELLVFANPNNPTGTILSRSEIETILNDTDTNLLIDETYVEFTNTAQYSSIPLTKKYENLFVVRGVSKFFAAPGIRLGYGITSSLKTKEYFNSNSMLWSINIFADLMGQVMFSDREYLLKVFEFISSQRQSMISQLSKCEALKVYSSQGNFVLCKILKEVTAYELREHLLKKALVIRDCSNFAGLTKNHFRFCILKEKDNDKLIREIVDYLK
ncbi:pyridoxal phosphate-dependent aminotransferase [Anaerosphaera multitolerans]|uniref:Aminotransferase n=1 Tax=Anaerosphaera multitolerans TaxID=2487351 RepID=A0A437S969_9FIRM|nr:histidinol-phosphate transaminase [Anaerosphaera multitolerans]RVU55656.1 aminotransferase class I/II-fold pyridoxal phosphate-dependent enzyme [Anaerosphaera multitolerans]